MTLQTKLTNPLRRAFQTDDVIINPKTIWMRSGERSRQSLDQHQVMCKTSELARPGRKRSKGSYLCLIRGKDEEKELETIDKVEARKKGKKRPENRKQGWITNHLGNVLR